MSMASNAKAFLGKEELVDLIADSMKKLKRKMQSKVFLASTRPDLEILLNVADFPLDAHESRRLAPCIAPEPPRSHGPTSPAPLVSSLAPLPLQDKQSKDENAEPEEEAGDPVHVRRKMQFILLVESMVEETRVQFMAEAFQRKGDGGAIKWEDDVKRCMRDIEENLEQHRSTEAARYNVDTYLRSVFSTFMDLRAATHRKWEIFLQQKDSGANRG